VILDIPHLAIPQGRVTAVVGPNGAGKSTLMNTLAFLEPYDQGEIFFKGNGSAERTCFPFAAG